MFSLETLGKCAVIVIHDLLPRKLKTSEMNSNQKDGFLFLAQDGEKLIVHENLGYDLTGIEIEHLRKSVYTWGGGDDMVVRNGVVEMGLPSFLEPFVREINSIPGCRISPNLLRAGGDVYLYIEYDGSVEGKVSGAVMNFLSQEFLFEKDLVYMGKQGSEVPKILDMYVALGNKLSDLFMVTTVWEFRDDQQKNQSDGIFQNRGTYVPKAFVNGSTDRLVFRVENTEILGGTTHNVVDRNRNLFEIEVKSRFFSDFYNNIVRPYSGPIFCHMEVTGESQKTYYLVEKNRHSQFIKGLKNHWADDARSNHINYIQSAGELGSETN